MLATSLTVLALSVTSVQAEELDLGYALNPSRDLRVTTMVGAQRLESEPAAGSSGGSGKHRIPLLAAGLNWFLPGTGYLYNGEKPVYVSLPMVAGAVGLTYIEQFHQFENGKLMDHDPQAFGIMFASVLALNTGAAIDAFREAKAINNGSLAERDTPRELELSLAPAALQGDTATSYGLSLDARF
jgi:hypothetical protein